MTLRAHLTAALARSTSQTPIATETLAHGHFRCRVEDELMAMYRERQVCCCEFFKGNNKPVVKWWLAGNIEGSPNLPQTTNYNNARQRRRAAKARAAK